MITFITMLAAAQLFVPSMQADPIKLSIEIERTIEAPSAEIYRLFSTSEGARTLFPGANASIDPRVGGEYRIAFLPGKDPTGESYGTAGCKILELQENRRLVFEWRGPIHFAEMNVTPLPTSIEVYIEPATDNPNHSRVRLRHRGFASGKPWDEYHAWFHQAWRGVFDVLELRYAAQPIVDRSQVSETTTGILIFLTPGANWQDGKPVQQQARFANHAAYMMHMLGKGELIIGGPLSGRAEGVLALNTDDWTYAKNLMAADPGVQSGMFTFTMKRWHFSMPKASK